MGDETLQAKIDGREVHVNVLSPTNESSNPPPSIEDQIANIELEMDQAYGKQIQGRLRTRKQRILAPTKIKGFSNTTIAKMQQKGKCNCLCCQQQRK
eukprot:759605-Ditylum_brightwellii.AAC.1